MVIYLTEVVLVEPYHRSVSSFFYRISYFACVAIICKDLLYILDCIELKLLKSTIILYNIY